ncbi:dimethylaniline monooxygenase [n-oxide-forming] [Plakobranchus ocellatus]|uniref:Dimethylaniline monooxygenase [n-oxide-forming] n=1 Tax=Plakobranchus ocellatus TaxID=259542 RepID=A0AAV3XVB5_9GAST|nr:dimethylaniline monooxygenase [n-oxide-forming] [Plakobranchus ocellatus]
MLSVHPYEPGTRTMQHETEAHPDSSAVCMVCWYRPRQVTCYKVISELSGPPSGQGAGGGVRTLDRRVPTDFRADSISTMPPTPPAISERFMLEFYGWFWH